MPGTTESTFTRAFLGSVAVRVGILCLAMATGAAGVALGKLVDLDWAPFLGGCAGLVLGFLLGRVLLRRWDPLRART